MKNYCNNCKYETLAYPPDYRRKKKKYSACSGCGEYYV